MLKVLVVDRCTYCDGEAYVYRGERTDEDGSQSPIYLPCYICKGSGEMEKQVSLREFQTLLDSVISMEPDNEELSRQKAEDTNRCWCLLCMQINLVYK